MRYILLLCLILSGCCTPPQQVHTVVPEKETVSIDASILRECEHPPALEVRRYSELELVELFKSWLGMLDACSDKQKSLANTARNAFNISKTDSVNKE